VRGGGGIRDENEETCWALGGMRHLIQQVGGETSTSKRNKGIKRRGEMRTHEGDTSNVPTSGLRDPGVENGLRD